jgi:hypothetical protein
MTKTNPSIAKDSKMYYTPEILNAEYLSETINNSTAKSVSSPRLMKVQHYNIDILNQRLVRVGAKRRFDHQYYLWGVETVNDVSVMALFWVKEASDIKRLSHWSVASSYAKTAHEKLWTRGIGWVYHAKTGKLMFRTGGFFMDTEHSISDSVLINANYTYEAQQLHGRDFEELYKRVAARGQNA